MITDRSSYDSPSVAQQQTMSSKKEFANQTDSIEPTKIIVTCLPDGIDKELMEMFFEHKSGSKIKEVIIDEEGQYAIVEFLHTNDETADRECAPVNSANETSAEYIRPKTIKVSVLPERATHEILVIFLENKTRECGGKVKCATVDDKKHSAIVEFEEPSAIDLIMKKRPIVIRGTEVQIGAITQVTPMTPDRCSTIKVSGLPEAAIEEILMMYFENENRQGGGKVKEVRINIMDRSAAVDFEEEKAVDIVLNKRPIKILGHEVDVQKYTQVTPLTIEKCSTIRVSGIPKAATEEILIMFFENEKRQGGGNVKKVCINKTDGSALVVFEEEKD
ncbi:uncharacterized protein LOC123531141 [Mercenaria mercenaria]|uniref:uncharacterized protein LOC123531141 n=1 Tax=Mercenaria mercenaria TaxID=6596 RepID=UPI00234F2239|nr:uncharacterized protein LOC123531141 [Mercenaria mercenaria]